jgi:hypothetical protein
LGEAVDLAIRAALLADISHLFLGGWAIRITKALREK